MDASRKILVLGASGLIGRFVTDDLRRKGFQVLGVARKFSASQQTGELDLELPIMAMDTAALTQCLRDRGIDVVVNCLGVLQDGPASDTSAVHRDFVERLLAAIKASHRAIRLIQVSIPGAAKDDRTSFSTTKREAERMIAASGISYAILRPGFVIAPSAYGGSAMVRALAALRLGLPAKDAARSFQPVAASDIAATIAHLAARDIDDPGAKNVSWDLMQPQPVTLGRVIARFRIAVGTEGGFVVTPFSLLVDFGARCGDLASWLGWMLPFRTTAIAELRRGVTGNPAPWMAATGIAPQTLDDIVRPATIQDKWFARLYLIKALIIASLVLFWGASGFIALFVSYDAAAGILRSHAFPPTLVAPITILTSLMDITIGVLIAFRRTCAFGLTCGILASLGYMFGAAILTPDLWIEPLGALVKTGPAIVLMLVVLVILDNR